MSAKNYPKNHLHQHKIWKSFLMTSLTYIKIVNFLSQISTWKPVFQNQRHRIPQKPCSECQKSEKKIRSRDRDVTTRVELTRVSILVKIGKTRFVHIKRTTTKRISKKLSRHGESNGMHIKTVTPKTKNKKNQRNLYFWTTFYPNWVPKKWTSICGISLSYHILPKAHWNRLKNGVDTSNNKNASYLTLKSRLEIHMISTAYNSRNIYPTVDKFSAKKRVFHGYSFIMNDFRHIVKNKKYKIQNLHFSIFFWKIR